MKFSSNKLTCILCLLVILMIGLAESKFGLSKEFILGKAKANKALYSNKGLNTLSETRRVDNQPASASSVKTSSTPTSSDSVVGKTSGKATAENLLKAKASSGIRDRLKKLKDQKDRFQNDKNKVRLPKKKQRKNRNQSKKVLNRIQK